MKLSFKKCLKSLLHSQNSMNKNFNTLINTTNSFKKIINKIIFAFFQLKRKKYKTIINKNRYSLKIIQHFQKKIEFYSILFYKFTIRNFLT